MELQSESVTQTETSSAVKVNSVEIDEVKDDAAKAMPDDFKKDFFKQKQIARDAKKREEELAERVKEFEEKEAERVGNHKKIIDTLKEENAKLKEDISVGDMKRRRDSFNDALISKATEMGFEKPKQIKNFLSDDDKAILIMDDDGVIDQYGMDKAFENVKKEWPRLFIPKEVKFADGVPKTNLNKSPAKSAKQMTSAERFEALRLKRTQTK